MRHILWGIIARVRRRVQHQISTVGCMLYISEKCAGPSHATWIAVGMVVKLGQHCQIHCACWWRRSMFTKGTLTAGRVILWPHKMCTWIEFWWDFHLPYYHRVAIFVCRNLAFSCQSKQKRTSKVPAPSLHGLASEADHPRTCWVLGAQLGVMRLQRNFFRPDSGMPNCRIATVPKFYNAMLMANGWILRLTSSISQITDSTSARRSDLTGCTPALLHAEKMLLQVASRMQRWIGYRSMGMAQSNQTPKLCIMQITKTVIAGRWKHGTCVGSKHAIEAQLWLDLTDWFKRFTIYNKNHSEFSFLELLRRRNLRRLIMAWG